jgi:7-carboxy-7-deazaguanine synthase
MDEKQIHQYIKDTGVSNITITGGEPLMQEGIEVLLELLASDESLYVEIETNGSINLEQFKDINNRPSFTMDYKLPGSNMEKQMLLSNMRHLTKMDTVKFVSGSQEDLVRMKEIVFEYELLNRTNVYISPVFGQIQLENIVEFMKDNKLNGATLQIQMHKVIWPPEKRGV